MCGNPMADHSTVMSEAADVSGLKEALCAQQQLLQKLYNELEAEREASASAVSEALSVILRLQGEKAAVKMEAEQYKRLSEQKICHAEESLAIIEDAIYQKEMEVAALDYQVQAYRYKLLSMGCADLDPGFGGTKFPDNLVQRNENLVGETSVGSIARRHSAPIAYKFKNVVCERDGCRMQERDLVSSIVEERVGEDMCEKVSDSEKKIDSSSSGVISSYWEQIRKLDERVKEIAGANYVSSRSETRSPSSLSSRVSRGSSCELSSTARNESSLCQPNKLGIMNGSDQTKGSDGVAADNTCSTSIHDVFEVPQAEGSLAKDEMKVACGSSKSLERVDVIHPEAVKMCARDEPDWLKKVLQSNSYERKLCQPSDIDCRLVVVQPTSKISPFHSTMNQVNATSEIVEAERPAESSSREEELKLLNEIKEKLDSMHDEIRGLEAKKPSSTREEPSYTREEPSLSMTILSEAMLHFWL